ncbi:MAG: hypothetical protein H0T73_11360 [Ardenticatenales bacterium]|nr:hypothetical protein [Ardenticatenales bacterium]
MALRRARRYGILDSLLSIFEGTRGTVLTLLVLPFLLFLVLWLPPLSLGERLLYGGYTALSRSGGSVTVDDGAQLTVPAEALKSSLRVQFGSISQLDFVKGNGEGVLEGATDALPDHLILKSPIYLGGIKGDAPTYTIWTLPLPADSEPYALLDLYEWNGASWNWLPHRLWMDDRQIETRPKGVPTAVAVMQGEKLTAQIAAISDENGDFVPRAGSTLTQLSPRLYLVQGDGSVGQIFSLSPLFQQSGALLLPVLHNIDVNGVIRSDLVDNLLIDPNIWRSHVDQIEALVMSTGHEGIIIDYRSVDPALRGEFSNFILTLGQRLALRNKILGVRVDEPVRLSEDEFRTGAYDWEVIGQAATIVQVPVPRAAGVFAGENELRALLGYATSHINRYKLEIEVPVAPYQIVNNQARPVPYSDILALLSSLAGRQEVTPETPLAELDAKIESLSLDSASGSYRLIVNDSPIYLEDANNLARRLALINEYHLGGVVVVDANQADPRVWDVLASYR